MAEVTLKLHQFDSLKEATKVADDIRNRGEVSYTDNSGSTVTVSVGDVTVNNA